MAFKNRIKSYFKLKTEKNKLQYIPEGIYLLFSIASIIYFAAIGQIRNSMLGVLAVAILFVVYAVEITLNLRLGVGFASILLFMIAGGVLLGPCYDLYFKVPIWDDILHGFAGVIFTCLGISLARGVIKGKQSIFTYLLFGVVISLSISVVWELFEWMGTNCFGLDMQEDTLINGFYSFYLTGSHNDIAEIDNITKTVIYYGDNQVLTLNGYLDIGLIDTLGDLINCTIGTVVAAILLIVSAKLNWKVDRVIIPENGFYRQKKAADETEPTETPDETEPTETAESTETADTSESTDTDDTTTAE